MKGKRFLVGLAVTTLAFGGSAMANEIYKWTDADGNIHYTDRPSGAVAEERLALSYSRTNSASVQQRVQTSAEARTAKQEAKAEAAEEAKAAEAKLAEAAEKQEKCENSRAQLATINQSRRLYREDADGERVYLDEKETGNARQRVEERITEHCAA